MDWLEQSTENCSVRRTLDVIGDKWTIQVIREAFHGVRRFDQMRDHIGVSDSVLSSRLRKLVDEGILETAEYRQAGYRRRKEYRLTASGRDIYPVIVSLLSWGDSHRPDPSGPAIEISHVDCGGAVDVEVRCAHGHRLSSPREAVASTGPGARLAAVPSRHR